MARRFSDEDVHNAKERGMVIISFAVAGDLEYSIEGPRNPTFAAKLIEFVNFHMIRGDASLIQSFGPSKNEKTEEQLGDVVRAGTAPALG